MAGALNIEKGAMVTIMFSIQVRATRASVDIRHKKACNQIYTIDRSNRFAFAGSAALI